MSKAAIRTEIRDRLRALDPQQKADADRRISDRVLELPEFQHARRIFCYLPLATEVDTRPIVAHLLATHGAAYVPITDIDARMLHVAEISSLDDLTEGPYGIPEPTDPRLVDPALIDLWIVPGIAFDRQGRRIGHGGGYFDTFFGAHPTSAPKVAVAYAFQVVDGVPADDHDVPVDLVVTEDEIWIAEEG